MKKVFTLLTLLVAIVTGAWADAVTIGYTNTTTTTKKEATTETVSGSGTDITVAKIFGTGNALSEYTTGDKGMKNESSTDVYSTHCYKWGVKTVNSVSTSSIDATYMNTTNPNDYVGFSFTVAVGKKFSISSISARLASSANHAFRIRIEDNAGNVLYTGACKVISNATSGGCTQNITGLNSTNAADIQELPAGTYKVKAFLAFNSTGKYLVFTKLQVTGTVEEDTTPFYDMTAAVDDEAHGTATVSDASVREGSSATFTATPKTGYKFVNWTNTSTSAVVSTDNPYNIASVSEAVSLTANFTNAYSISYNVTDGSRGTTTTGLETEYANDADKFTAPQNYYIFKDGNTLDHWTDGVNNYIPDTEYTLTENIVLQPVFTANTKTLDDRTAATIVTWSFNYVGDEAPAISIENRTGYYVKQATIDGVSTDIVMAIDNTTGSAIAGVYGKTVNNYNKETQSSNTYAQVNRGSKWTIPAVKGMTIVAYSATGNFLDADDESDPDESKWKYATRVGGVVATSGTGTKIATWVYTGEDATIDYVAGNDAGYISKLVVTYPAPYSVNYDGNGADSGTTTDASTYDKNATVTTKANSFVKAGYAFTGWNTEADGSGTEYAAGETFTITGNTTLYAQWMDGSGASITYTLNVGTSASTTILSSTSTTDETNITSISVDQTNAAGDGAGANNGRTTKLPIKTGANGETYDSPTNYVLFKFAVAKKFIPTDIAIKVANVGSSSANNIKYKATLSDNYGNSISNTYVVKTQDGTVETFLVTNSEKVGFAGDVTLKLWAWTITDKSNGGTNFRMGTPLTISGVVADDEVPITTKAGRNYATCVTPAAKKLDFANAEGITAYIATGLNGAEDAVVLKEVDVVPAGTPIIVKTDTKGATVNVPVTTADASDVSGNELVAGDGVKAYNNEGNSYYYLASDQFHLANAGILQSGKAYLEVAGATAPQLSIVFGDSQTTGINAVNGEGLKVQGSEVYNLNGQRVLNPTKGLYIVNGKKVIVK